MIDGDWYLFFFLLFWWKFWFGIVCFCMELLGLGGLCCVCCWCIGDCGCVCVFFLGWDVVCWCK